MPTTTKFQDWLDTLDDTDIEQINNLYESIILKTEMGYFNCKENPSGQLFVTESGNDLILALLSDDAIKLFLKLLDDTYGEDVGVQLQWEFVRNMRKDD